MGLGRSFFSRFSIPRHRLERSRRKVVGVAKRRDGQDVQWAQQSSRMLRPE